MLASSPLGSAMLLLSAVVSDVAELVVLLVVRPVANRSLLSTLVVPGAMLVSIVVSFAGLLTLVVVVLSLLGRSPRTKTNSC